MQEVVLQIVVVIVDASWEHGGNKRMVLCCAV